MTDLTAFKHILAIDAVLALSPARVLVIQKTKYVGVTRRKNVFMCVSTNPGGGEYARFLLEPDLPIENYGITWGLRYHIE